MNQNAYLSPFVVVGLVAALVIAIIGSSPSDAIQAEAAPKTAAAVVNLEKAFNGLEEWVAVESRLRDMGTSLEDEAARRKEAVEAMFADTEDYPVGSEKFKEAQRRYEIAALEFQAYVAMHQARRIEFNDTEIRRIYEDIKVAARTIADERGLDLILVDDSVVPIPEQSKDILAQISSRRVLFARDNLDITEALITKMNNAYRARGS